MTAPLSSATFVDGIFPEFMDYKFTTRMYTAEILRMFVISAAKEFTKRKILEVTCPANITCQKNSNVQFVSKYSVMSVL